MIRFRRFNALRSPGGDGRSRGGRRGRLLATATVVALSSAAITSSAHAIPYDQNAGVYGTTVVDGKDTVKDDFGDHYAELGNSLCNGCADSQGTDLVLMWQAILFSEGLIHYADIHGYFNTTTSNATKAWQTRYGLAADGMVGPRTWDMADNRLFQDANSPSYVTYYSSFQNGTVEFNRGAWGNPHGAYALFSAENPVDPFNDKIYFFGGTYDRIHLVKRTLSTHN